MLTAADLIVEFTVDLYLIVSLMLAGDFGLIFNLLLKALIPSIVCISVFMSLLRSFMLEEAPLKSENTVTLMGKFLFAGVFSY